MPLFDRVSYHISKSITQSIRREVGRILDANGAVDAALDHATHVVTDTIDFEGANTLQKGAACVTPYWVERSMELGVLQDPKYFSSDRELIFSGIVATSAGIPPGDKEVIIAGIRECGGQWREGLTRDVTHLFVTNTSSQKYATAMHFRDSARITILLPQWFDQCWSMQMRLPHNVFEFPDPPYMRRDHDVNAYRAQMRMNENTTERHDKRNMFRTMQHVDASPAPAISSAAGPAPRDIWQRRAILLSSSLALDARRRESVEERIRRNGGVVVVPADGDAGETAAVERADVLVTQYRTGPAYGLALAAGKMIGTLAWLFCVERSGIVSSPRDRLLHYPVRNKPIEGFAGHEITVTNYQGDEREYLKKLIELMGAKFTPTMSGRNTVVIAAYKGGTKTERAEQWSVPIVTHKWLEDCFVEWRNLTPAQKKYLDYAPGVNYGTVIGDRGVGRMGLEEDPELPPERSELARVSAQQDPKKDQQADVDGPQKKSPEKTTTLEAPTGTATSTREAQEAEEVEGVLDVGGDIDYVNDVPPPVDVEEEPGRQQVFTPHKVGPPRGVKKTPAKSDSMKSETKSKPPSPSAQQRIEAVSSPSRKGKEKEKPLVERNNDDSDSDDGPRGTKPLHKDRDNTPTKARMTAKLTPRPKPTFNKKTALASEDGSGTDEHVSRPIRTITKKPMSRKGPTFRDEDDNAEDAPQPAAKPKPKLGKKTAPMPIDIGSNSDEMHSRVDETPPRTVSKLTPKKYQSKGKAKSAATAGLAFDSETEDSASELFAKKTDTIADTGMSKRGLMPSPTRILSVELPEPRSLLRSMKSRRRTPERRCSEGGSKSASSPAKSSPITHKAKPPPRAIPTRAAAHQVLSVEMPKRGHPAVKHHTNGPRTSSPAVTPPPVKRTPSRRFAAAAATQRLRHEVMPDVINYENETKRESRGVARRRKTSSTAEIEDDEDATDESESEAREKKKQKIAPRGVRSGGNDPGAPPVNFITHVRPNKRPAPTDDEDDSGPGLHQSRPGGRKKTRIAISISDDGSSHEVGVRRSSCDPKKIYILTTKVELRDDVCKSLMQLGVKFTEKPAQCTHLVAISFARTEKFLCALSNAPFVLNASWLLESSAKKMILAESDYFLKDPAMEEKHSFKLTESIERARTLKKRKEKLLQGHFFYFTANVPIDFDLMKNVIRASGAECIKKTPTIRNLSSTRHVISCETDENLWRPLAKQGFPIYSAELILTAACAQFVDWEGEDKRVPGSF